MESFVGWLRAKTIVAESDTRYSVEVNFRSKVDEVLGNYAKICLGYVSAALKNNNYHVKQVFDQEPYRIMISARNWDDGEWVGLLSWNKQKKRFIVSKGFFNKDRKTVSVQNSKETDSDNASSLANEIRSLMHGLKDVPDRHVEKLKKVPLKRGPK